MPIITCLPDRKEIDVRDGDTILHVLSCGPEWGRGNIEIGVRLRGDPAHEARKIFSHLVESRVVVEVG